MRILMAVALVALLSPTTLDACSCVGPSPHPSCNSAGDAAAVFTGTVLSIALPPRPSPPMEPLGQRGSVDRRSGSIDYALHPPPWPLRVVRMQLTEALSGVEPWQKEIEVGTGLGGGDCGYPFQMGQDYVVY